MRGGEEKRTRSDVKAEEEREDESGGRSSVITIIMYN